MNKLEFILEKQGIDALPEPTVAQKKRSRFSTMFTLHQMLNRAGVQHENKNSLICSGYIKSKDRF